MLALFFVNFTSVGFKRTFFVNVFSLLRRPEVYSTLVDNTLLNPYFEQD